MLRRRLNTCWTSNYFEWRLPALKREALKKKETRFSAEEPITGVNKCVSWTPEANSINSKSKFGLQRKFHHDKKWALFHLQTFID